MRFSLCYNPPLSRVDPENVVQGDYAHDQNINHAVAFSLASATMFSNEASYAQANPGAERLYILNCGEGVAGDISRWSPGVNVGKSMGFFRRFRLPVSPWSGGSF